MKGPQGPNWAEIQELEESELAGMEVGRISMENERLRDDNTLLAQEVSHLSSEVRRLVAALKWAGQTIHNAHHYDPEASQGGATWQECGRGFCESIRHHSVVAL